MTKQANKIFYAAVILSFALVTAPCGASQPDAATPTYRWKDVAGTAHISDYLTPEAARNGYVVLSVQGYVVERVPGQKSTEQIKIEQRRAEQAKAKAEETKRAEMLLQLYETEADLVEAQEDVRKRLKNRIKMIKINIRGQITNLGQLLEQANRITSKGNPVPKYLSVQVVQQKKVISKQAHWLSSQKKKFSEMVIHQDQKLQRYLAYKKQKENGLSDN